MDSDPIQNELSAISNVIDKYLPGLASGTTDPAEYYDAFISDLDDAGMDIVIETYQNALDEWLAEK